MGGAVGHSEELVGAQCDAVPGSPVAASEGRHGRAVEPLLTRYAAGDAAAFGELYEVLAPRLRRFCLRLSRRGSEAVDLFQDTLLRLHRARASYVPGAPALPWIFAIARAAFVDRHRHRHRHPEDLTAIDDSQS